LTVMKYNLGCSAKDVKIMGWGTQSYQGNWKKIYCL